MIIFENKYCCSKNQQQQQKTTTKNLLLSRIRSTNFHSLTTRGPLLTAFTLALHYCYISPRTTVPIIHCTDDTHSWLHWLHSWFPSQTLLRPWTSSSSLQSIVQAFITHLVIAALRSLVSSSSLSLVILCCLVSWSPACVYWINPLPAV